MTAAAVAVLFVEAPQVAQAASPSQMVVATNKERAKAGLPALKSNPQLARAAQMKANDMAKKGYFSHTSPSGLSPKSLLSYVKYLWRAYAENIAVSTKSTQNFVANWMQSPGHRKNILNPQYKEIGIATASGYYNGRPVTFAVQEFGTRR